jgi:hypothetical protein
MGRTTPRTASSSSGGIAAHWRSPAALTHQRWSWAVRACVSHLSTAKQRYQSQR